MQMPRIGTEKKTGLDDFSALGAGNVSVPRGE